MNQPAPLNRCRCGARPHIAHEVIAPPDDAWAIHCADLCGNDTHWQNTLEKASELWNSGQVRNQRGGQADD